ncbi:ataxin-1-like isoform X2 [Ornithodoros turicata]
MLSLSRPDYVAPLALCSKERSSEPSPLSPESPTRPCSGAHHPKSSSVIAEPRPPPLDESAPRPAFGPYRASLDTREWPHMNVPPPRAPPKISSEAGATVTTTTESPLVWLSDVSSGPQSDILSPAARLYRQQVMAASVSEPMFQYPPPMPPHHTMYQSAARFGGGQPFSFLPVAQYGTAGYGASAIPTRRPPYMDLSLLSRPSPQVPFVSMPVPVSPPSPATPSGKTQRHSFSSLPKSPETPSTSLRTPEHGPLPPSPKASPPVREQRRHSVQSPIPFAIYEKETEVESVIANRSPGPYRMPSGKEGSLKHRILHPPPSINITEPPPAVLDSAPLSAPPIRTSREDAMPSPKFTRVLDPVMPRLAVSASPSSSKTEIPSSHTATPALHYPAYFMKGSIIQLGNGLLKKVEDLNTDDFINSASVSRDLRIDSSRVVRIADLPGSTEAGVVALLSFSVGQNQVQVTVEAPTEHPFFVFNQGWSSCSPERSLQRYRLRCHQLAVGDVCISLTHRSTLKPHASPTPKLPMVQEGSVKLEAPVDVVGETSRSVVMSAASSLELRRATTAVKADPMNPLSIGEQGNKRKRRWSAPDQVASGENIPVPERTATT